MSSKIELYEFCKRKREEGYEWHSILKLGKKDGRWSTTLTVEELIDFYRDVAGRIAAGEKFDDDGSPYNDAANKLLEVNGKNKDYFKKLSNNKPSSKNKFILTISDTHVPYHNREMLANIFEQESKLARTLVIAGDLMNADALSSHLKFKNEDFAVELAETRAFLEYSSSLFDVSYVVNGNHDEDRFRRHMANTSRPDLHSLYNNPLNIVTHGLNNVKRSCETHKWSENSEKFAQELGHTLIIGDCLWSHLTFSGKDGKSVRSVRAWYEKWKSVFNFPEIKVFQQGHTHQLGVNYDYDSAIIQTGCMVSLDGLSYSLESHGKSSPPCYGYNVIEQIDGKTNLSNIRVVKL